MEVNKKILALVSGGPDSICMLHKMFTDNRYSDCYIYVLHVIDNNSESAYELAKVTAESVLKISESTGFTNYQLEIKSSEDISPSETRMRNIRKKYAMEIIKQFNISEVYTGHHMNDEIENKLISIFKNRINNLYLNKNPKTYQSIKILSDMTKEEVIQYCIDNNLNYTIDKSNKDNNNIRNIIRNILMPSIYSLNDYDQYLNSLNSFFNRNNELNNLLNINCQKFIDDNCSFIYCGNIAIVEIDNQDISIEMLKEVIRFILAREFNIHVTSENLNQFEKRYFNESFINGELSYSINANCIIYYSQKTEMLTLQVTGK